jgi:hypothetical protein
LPILGGRLPGRDADLSQRLVGLYAIGKSVGVDRLRRRITRPADRGTKQDEQEDEGESGQADPYPLDALAAAGLLHSTNLAQDATNAQSRLDARCCDREGALMKTLLLIIAASASLMACEKEVIVEGGNKVAVDTSNVVLPPSITATKTYRCKDNSLVYIDWLTDGSARVKKDKAEVGTPVVIGAAGTPSLKGAATDATVTYNGLSCKA